MQVEFINSFTGMQGLKEEWANLFQNTIYHSLYGDPEFSLNWIKYFGSNQRYAPREHSDKDQMARPILIVGRNYGRADLIMPIILHPLRFLRSNSRSMNLLINSIGTS